MVERTGGGLSFRSNNLICEAYTEDHFDNRGAVPEGPAFSCPKGIARLAFADGRLLCRATVT